MSWAPQIDSVRQLTEVLSQSVSPDNQTRSRAKQVSELFLIFVYRVLFFPKIKRMLMNRG